MRAWRAVFVPLIFLVSWGCAADHAAKKESVALAPPRVEMPEFILHRVMPGETLATIAKWYSGKDSNWKELSEHNPGLSPWKLHQGDIVKVPLTMATVHKDQPNYSTAPKKAKTKKGTTGGGGEEVSGPDTEEVFGPK